MKTTCASFLRNILVKLLSPATSTIWLVSFVRGLLNCVFRESRVIRENKSRKISVVHVQIEQTVLQSGLVGTIYIATNRTVSVSVHLMANPRH